MCCWGSCSGFKQQDTQCSYWMQHLSSKEQLQSYIQRRTCIKGAGLAASDAGWPGECAEVGAAAGAPVTGVQLASGAAAGGMVQPIPGAHHAFIISNVPSAGADKAQGADGQRSAGSGHKGRGWRRRRQTAATLPRGASPARHGVVAGRWCLVQQPAGHKSSQVGFGH